MEDQPNYPQQTKNPVEDVIASCLGTMMQPEYSDGFTRRQVLSTAQIVKELEPMIEVEVNTLAVAMQRFQYAITTGPNGPGWEVWRPEPD